MKLTREERERVLAGDHSALKRERKPEVEDGDGYVLIWSRAQSVITDRSSGATANYPRRPLVWLRFAEPIRHRDGGWRIALEYHDERVKPRFLGPASAPTDEEQLTDETARGYRSSAAGAIDHLEAEDDEELARQQVKSDERWADHREEMAAEEETRRQERAIREELREAMRKLGPQASQYLLAGVERLIRNSLAHGALPQDQVPQNLPERRTLRHRRTR